MRPVTGGMRSVSPFLKSVLDFRSFAQTTVIGEGALDSGGVGGRDLGIAEIDGSEWRCRWGDLDRLTELDAAGGVGGVLAVVRAQRGVAAPGRGAIGAGGI